MLYASSAMPYVRYAMPYAADAGSYAAGAIACGSGDMLRTFLAPLRAPRLSWQKVLASHSARA